MEKYRVIYQDLLSSEDKAQKEEVFEADGWLDAVMYVEKKYCGNTFVGEGEVAFRDVIEAIVASGNADTNTVVLDIIYLKDGRSLMANN